MKQNESLNNTCILFVKDNEAQQKAIIRFYNDNGWDNHNMNKHSYDTCIGVRFRDLDYWQNSPQSMHIIDLPKDYYPIDTQEFIYKGYFDSEAEKFFGDKIIEEERDGCAVVGFFVALENNKTHMLSKGDKFIKDSEGNITLSLSPSPHDILYNVPKFENTIDTPIVESEESWQTQLEDMLEDYEIENIDMKTLKTLIIDLMTKTIIRSNQIVKTTRK